MIEYFPYISFEVVLINLSESHNQKISNKSNQIKNQYNCASDCKYDLNGGNCRSENIFYKATNNFDLEKKFNIGLCSAQFRFRYATIKKNLKVVCIKTRLSRW